MSKNKQRSITKEQILEDVEHIDNGWWYATIPKFYGNVHKDLDYFDNPIIWDKLKKVFDEQK